MDEPVSSVPGHVYQLDGKGGIVEIPPDSPVLARARGLRLILLPADAPECRDWLLAQFGGVRADALMDADPRPHCTIYDEGALIALIADPGNAKGSGDGRRHVQLWIERGRAIAVWGGSVGDLLGLGGGSGAHAPTSPVHLITRIALRAADRIEPQLDALSDKTDDLEEEVLGAPNDRTRVRLNAVRRGAIQLRRTLLPQRDALTTLETAAFTFITARDRARLREAAGWTTRLAAEMASFSERAALVQEQITDRRAEQLNRSLLILAAVTTIFMPLTLITGLIGMNVEGIPFAGEPWAFPVIVGALLIIGLLEYLWFRSRKWL